VRDDGAQEKVALKLLAVESDGESRLRIQKSCFLNVFRAFDLDSYILHLILHDVDGFHDLGAENVNPDDGGSKMRTYFLGVRGSHMLAWSFNTQTRQTLAIPIERGGLQSIRATEDMITLYKAYIRHHPLVLGIACADQLLKEVDGSIPLKVSTVVSVEKRTGYSYFIGPVEDDTASVHDEDVNPTGLSG
jgi:hypothetical protein